MNLALHKTQLLNAVGTSHLEAIRHCHEGTALDRTPCLDTTNFREIFGHSFPLPSFQRNLEPAKRIKWTGRPVSQFPFYVFTNGE